MMKHRRIATFVVIRNPRRCDDEEFSAFIGLDNSEQLHELPDGDTASTTTVRSFGQPNGSRGLLTSVSIALTDSGPRVDDSLL